MENVNRTRLGWVVASFVVAALVTTVTLVAGVVGIGVVQSAGVAGALTLAIGMGFTRQVGPLGAFVAAAIGSFVGWYIGGIVAIGGAVFGAGFAISYPSIQGALLVLFLPICATITTLVSVGVTSTVARLFARRASNQD
jgi:hypothetical protein